MTRTEEKTYFHFSSP